MTLVSGILCILRTSLSSVTGLSELVTSKKEKNGVWGRGRKDHHQTDPTLLAWLHQQLDK